ncbi:hypothetical protein Tco_0245416 [Tanacetum coccineum]
MVYTGFFPPPHRKNKFAVRKKEQRTLLLMMFKRSSQPFHALDEAKEMLGSHKTRFGVMRNSKKIQKAVFKTNWIALCLECQMRRKSQVFEVPSPGVGQSSMTMENEKNIEHSNALPEAKAKHSSASYSSYTTSSPKHNNCNSGLVMKFKGRYAGGSGRGQDFKPVRTEKEALMTIDEGQINWVEQTTDEELNHALMAFTVNNEVSMCSKLCLDSYNALQAKYDELQSEFGDQEAALTAHKLAEDIDDSLYEYGKYGPQPQSPSPTVSDASSTVYSTCPSNDSDGELGATSNHSVNDDPIHDHIPIPSIEQKNWNQLWKRELGAGYSFERKPCFMCGSLSHLIKDCDYYEKKMAREAALKCQRVVHAHVWQATLAWTNTNRVNKANQFTPRPVQLSNIRPHLNTVSTTLNTGRVNVNTGHGNVSTDSSTGTHNKFGSSRFNAGKHNVNSGSVHVNSSTQIKSGSSRFNTAKRRGLLKQPLTLIYIEELEDASNFDLASYYDRVEKQLIKVINRNLKIKKFLLNTSYCDKYESWVTSLIRYALISKVEELDLSFWYDYVLGFDKLLTINNHEYATDMDQVRCI